MGACSQVNQLATRPEHLVEVFGSCSLWPIFAGEASTAFRGSCLVVEVMFDLELGKGRSF